MNESKILNNQVTLSGEIVENFKFSHEIFGEGFYTAMLASERQSEIKDIIPIMVSERLVDVKSDWIRCFVRVSGQFRSYNKHEGERSRLVLSVFVREIETWEDDGTIRPIDENSVFLDGYICKPPIYRKTPLNREITDILLAVNRPYGKSDYIPCICWGRNARCISGFNVGDNVQFWGRIQSREYSKKISEPYKETGTIEHRIERRTAYEVSVSKMEECSYEQDED